MNYRADVMAANPNKDHDGFIHSAYRQYGNMDALEPGTERLFHHASFGQLEIDSLPPMESTPAIGQTDFRTLLDTT